MRLLISFFLSLFIYTFLIGMFVFFIIYSNKQTKSEKVYIHQVISIKHNKKKKLLKIRKVKKKIKKVKKEKKKEIVPEKKVEVKKAIQKVSKNSLKKTEDNFAKGGEDIKFDDIFANTPDNIPTKKVKEKKTEEMTKEKGNSEEFSKLVKKELSQLESNVAIVSNSDKKSSNYILNEFEKVWVEINTKDGNFVILKVDVLNGKLNVFVISTNLDTILLNSFLSKLQNIDIKKIREFHGKITFKTKLKG